MKNMPTSYAYIISAKRTPIGGFMGGLSKIAAPQLGAEAIKSVLEECRLSSSNYDKISEVIMGEVLPAGVGQAPARQAAKAAGLPDSVGALTINKMCGSGLKATMLGATAIQAGLADLMLCGGMENMSLAPYLLPKARKGFRLGHGQVQDSMIVDGLWDVYNDFHMGNAAEMCATEFKFSRQDQDDFTRKSYERARHAMENGLFQSELTAVEDILSDEEPTRVDLDRLPSLKPAFHKQDGTVTAGNASSISDGAAALLLASESALVSYSLKPLASIKGFATAALAPEWFTIAPADAIAKLLDQTGLAVSDIDLFEINEAFAVVPLAVAKKLDLDLDRINVHGGAVALGHPIGASGARILVTLTHALKQRKLKRGIAAICLGGGEAVAVLVELCDE